METAVLLVVALGIFGFGLVSKRAERSVLTAPILFTSLGIAAGAAGLGLVEMDAESEGMHLLAELTLALVLFTDASRIRLASLWRHHDLPIRMLVIGFPLTIAFGAGVAALLFPGLNGWEAALLAAVLAPTDAALGQAVVSNRDVPVRIRQTLNVESGLNDGIALPVVLLLMTKCASMIAGETGFQYWARFAVLQVTVGPAVGVVVGLAGARAVRFAASRGWMDEPFEKLSAVSIALLAFAGAIALEGNGFIAAFVAGIAAGYAIREHASSLHDFAEAEGQLLTLLVFLFFGAALVPEAIAHLEASSIFYVVLSLTAIRMLPVAVSLIGRKLRKDTVLFLGWFGPRGVASVLFALVVIEDSVLEAREQVFHVALLTVLASVFLHGATAYPAARAYARRLQRAAEGEAPEQRPVPEMRARLRHRER